MFSQAAIANSAGRARKTKSQLARIFSQSFVSLESRVCVATKARGPYESEVGPDRGLDVKPPSCKLKITQVHMLERAYRAVAKPLKTSKNSA